MQTYCAANNILLYCFMTIIYFVIWMYKSEECLNAFDATVAHHERVFVAVVVPLAVT